MKHDLTGKEPENFTADSRTGGAHIVRPRMNRLIAEAARSPFVIVCAGTGCGKTRAVSDFLRQQDHATYWVQISERDNTAAHYWEKFIDVTRRHDERLADQCKEMGFPETADKMDQFFAFRNKALKNGPHIIVFDDFHHLKDPSVLLFMEKMINAVTPDIKILLICRNMPKINMEVLQLKGIVSEISEADLDFTESELIEYFKQQGVTVDHQTTREIYKDTGGWPFAANLAARSLKKVPMYSGFVKKTLRQNIYKVMEAENWDTLPGRLRRFLVQLSLIDRVSTDLADILSGHDGELLSGLERQNAYMRFDNYGGVYLCHHLYLDFLHSKQDILTEEEKKETYMAAADWCKQNNFKTDALGYYEKMGDYESIVSILWDYFEHTTYEQALFVSGIFERAPAETFDRAPLFAALHVYNLLCLGKWQEFFAQAEAYEKRLTKVPLDDPFRNQTLGGIYYVWGAARRLMGTIDARHDFDEYFVKMAECLSRSPLETAQVLTIPVGAWANAAGSSQKGAPQKYNDAMARMVQNVSPFFRGVIGADELCRGELSFYQNDTRLAETLLYQAIGSARESKQFEIMQRSLFYIMRIAILQGDHGKAEQAMKELEALLDEEGYSRRFITYDIALGWYYCVIRQHDAMPDWLKNDFEPYAHAHNIENFGNQIKARYHYSQRNYLPVLIYIREMKHRESVLYGRAEMLALEACIHYKMKNKPAAWASFKEAYEAAAPNDILVPFIELGKDMRTLAMAAMRESENGIPPAWLELVRSKASSYSKYQSLIISEYRKANGMEHIIDLSPREKEILYDLYQGISRSEIATNRNIKKSTVNTIVSSVYRKLDAQSITDIVRIVSEQKLI
jgi:LuxR family maltose regulon positive regulatory protein